MSGSPRSRTLTAFRWSLLAVLAALAVGADQAGAVVLHQQTVNSGSGVTSQDFADSEAADDFTVPPGGHWTIREVQVIGQSAGQVERFSVRIYANGTGDHPAALISDQPFLRFTTPLNPNLFSIPLDLPVELGEGTYWVSVRAQGGLTQWFWLGGVQYGNPAAWRNPSDSFGTGCTDWTTRSTCAGGDPDQAFALIGDSTHALTVSTADAQLGSVSSSPIRIDCGTSCSSSFEDGTEVSLTALPAQGAAFEGWSGCDSVSGLHCIVEMNADRSVSAAFAPARDRVVVTKSGRGTVLGPAAGIDCGRICSGEVTRGTAVTFEAKPRKGWRLRRWRGCDSVQAMTCTVTPDADHLVKAKFTRRR